LGKVGQTAANQAFSGVSMTPKEGEL
jgi:hypothetical protein